VAACHSVDYGPDIEREIERLDDLLAVAQPELQPMPRRGLAIALLEGIDSERVENLGRGILDEAAAAITRLEKLHGDSMDILIAERRHGAAMGLARQTVLTSLERRRDRTDLIDRVLVNRVLGLPIFLGTMYAVFVFTFTVAEQPMEWIEAGFGWLGGVIAGLWPAGSESILQSLIVDGIIGGVGGVLAFLPNIVLLFLAISLLLRRTLFAGGGLPFLMELPPYRMPTLRSIGQHVAERSWLYVRKAGTIILGISIVMWAMATFPRLDQDTVVHDGSGAETRTADLTDEELASAQLSHSLVGRMGRAMEPVIAPMGFDWRIGTALIGAFAAKEVFVAQLGIVYSLGNTDETGAAHLRESLRADYSPLAGFCIMLFALIASPCMATVAVIRRESGSWRWAAFQFLGLTVLAWIVTVIVYQTGTLLGLGA